MNTAALTTATLRITLFAMVNLSCATLATAAGMDSQLNDLYQDMENHTEPGSYETMRRTGYFGGRYSYRTQIVDENLISISMPYVKAGCGGIDAFGGAFSHVNSDQLVNLMKQVASNAKGYAFQLALDTMCSTCMKWMNELQTKIQKVVGDLSNSCQLAQGIVDASVEVGSAMLEKRKTDFMNVSLAEAVSDDWGDLKDHINSPDNPFTRLFDKDQAAFDNETGAVVYKAMKEQNIMGWFPVAGDENLLEEILSITGSMVITGLKNVPDPNDPNAPPTREPEFVTLKGGLLSLEDLMFGVRQKPVYDCGVDTQTPYCRIENKDTVPRDIDGLKPKLERAFFGPNGLITWIRQRNLNSDLNQEQRNILSAMPDALGTKIYNLASLSPGAAEQLVRDSIDYIVLEVVWNLVNQAFNAAETAVMVSKQKNQADQLKALQDTEDKLWNEYMLLISKYSNDTIDAHYDLIIRNLTGKPEYKVTGSPQNSSGLVY